MKWFKYDINNLDLALYERYFSLMSKERKGYVNFLKNEADRKRTVAGEMLIKTALCDDTLSILRDEHGKPYIKDSNLHISISHSGDFAVCAIDEKPIGIDIEQIRDIKLKTAEKFCNEKELMYINECDGISRFFEIWTAKESAYKMLGGSIKNFKEIDTLKLNKEYFKFSDYTVCIVTE